MKLFLILLLCLCPLVGYTQTAEVGGAVQDSSGAVIPKASVEFRNQDTGIRRQATTSNDGYYHIVGMDPGKYDTTVQAKGFKTLTRENVVFQVGDKSQIDFKMQVGEANQTVTVDGSGLQLNTTDASVGTVIDRKFVENIPLNGRSFQDLILMTPGVVTQSPQATTGAGVNGNFSVNGQRTESNNYIVDGVSGNTSPGVGGTAAAPNISGNVGSSTALGTTQSLVSVDALQEFRVTSSSYSAEYGRTPGGQFSFVTRSGANDFHGSLFDYFRNDIFDANNWFNNYFSKPKQALRQNDFGGTIGGPVRIPRIYEGKGKSFFFVSYEGLRLVQPQPASLQYVPSLSIRQQAPAALQPVLNAFPLPTVGAIDYGTGLAQFIQATSVPSSIDSTSIRADHDIPSKVHLFFRFSDNPSSTATRSLAVLNSVRFLSHTYTLGATSQFTNNVSDELRVGYVEGRSAQQSILDTFGGAAPINLPATLAAANGPNARALFDFIAGAQFAVMSTQNATNQMNQWNVTDALSRLLGKHQLKAGFDYRRLRVPFAPASPSITYIYSSQSQILANKSLQASAGVQLGAVPLYTNFSAFAQDEWHISQRVTLSLGVRWELNPPPSAEGGNLPYILQGTLANPSGLSVAPKGTALWNTAKYNFAPRAGIAWTAHSKPGYETVVRIGGGVFFDTGNQTASFGYNGIGFSASQTKPGAVAPFPGGITLVPSVQPPYTTASVYGIYPRLQLPYTLEWSTALEQALGQRQALTLTYVGSNGRRLLNQAQYSIASLNPQFRSIVLTINGPTSNYQSLQVQFQRAVAHGLQALASYTWSHSIDFGSNNYALPIIRGNSDFDLRNNLAAGASWEIPMALRKALTKALLADWALDGRLIARSGFPVTLLGNLLTDPATGNQYYGGVNIVVNQPIYLNVAGLPGGRKINSAAFALPTGTQSGNAPRNFVRGFGATQVNMAVRREFKLYDSLNLQFRAEGFNILNHPSFGLIDAKLTDSTFGQSTQTLNQSLGTTSALYQAGGPRSLQFALKLQF